MIMVIIIRPKERKNVCRDVYRNAIRHGADKQTTGAKKENNNKQKVHTEQIYIIYMLTPMLQHAHVQQCPGICMHLR